MVYNEIAYHGTIEPFADNILAEQQFYISSKPNEWLGYGIYFFPNLSHADWWAGVQSRRHKKPSAVLSALIQCDDTSYFNLDLNENSILLNNFSEELRASLKREGVLIPHFKDEKEMHCFFIEAFKETHPTIKLISYTFNTPGNYNGLMFRPRQLQYCVVDGTIIHDIKFVSKGGVPT